MRFSWSANVFDPSHHIAFNASGSFTVDVEACIRGGMKIDEVPTEAWFVMVSDHVVTMFTDAGMQCAAVLVSTENEVKDHDGLRH